MDDFDRAILNALQDNGRLTNQALAEKIGLTHSACSRRVKRLEEKGVIRGYRACVDRAAVGQSIHAFASVERAPDADWRAVAKRLSKIEEVIGCYVMSGDVDILLEILASDMDHYSTTVLDRVLSTEGVNATRSAFVFQELKSFY